MSVLQHDDEKHLPPPHYYIIYLTVLACCSGRVWLGRHQLHPCRDVVPTTLISFPPWKVMVSLSYGIFANVLRLLQEIHSRWVNEWMSDWHLKIFGTDPCPCPCTCPCSLLWEGCLYSVVTIKIGLMLPYCTYFSILYDGSDVSEEPQ